MEWNDVRFRAQCTPFRHLAFFSDMAPQWTWMRDRLGAESQALNLFGNTGVRTTAHPATSASLVHFDAPQNSVEAGQADATPAGLAVRPPRLSGTARANVTARVVRRCTHYYSTHL